MLPDWAERFAQGLRPESKIGPDDSAVSKLVLSTMFSLSWSSDQLEELLIADCRVAPVEPIREITSHTPRCLPRPALLVAAATGASVSLWEAKKILVYLSVCSHVRCEHCGHPSKSQGGLLVWNESIPRGENSLKIKLIQFLLECIRYYLYFGDTVEISRVRYKRRLPRTLASCLDKLPIIFALEEHIWREMVSLRQRVAAHFVFTIFTLSSYFFWIARLSAHNCRSRSSCSFFSWYRERHWSMLQDALEGPYLSYRCDKCCIFRQLCQMRESLLKGVRFEIRFSRMRCWRWRLRQNRIDCWYRCTRRMLILDAGRTTWWEWRPTSRCRWLQLRK